MTGPRLGRKIKSEYWRLKKGQVSSSSVLVNNHRRLKKGQMSSSLLIDDGVSMLFSSLQRLLTTMHFLHSG